MSTDTNALLEDIAHELNMPQDELLRQGLHIFLEKRLKAVRAEVFGIHSKYGVCSVEEMDARYRDGDIEEDVSWRDMQRLDHLEYERDRLARILGMLE